MFEHLLLMSHVIFHNYRVPTTLTGIILSLLVGGLALVSVLIGAMTLITTKITNMLCKYKVRFSLLYAFIINPIIYIILGLFLHGIVSNFIALLLTMYVYAVKNKEENKLPGDTASQELNPSNNGGEGSAFLWALISSIITYILVIIPFIIILFGIFTPFRFIHSFLLLINL